MVYTYSMNDSSKQTALTFLKDRTLGTLATLSGDGTPRARTIHYVASDAFEIYFITLAGTRKVEDINANHLGSFVVYDDAVPRTVQIEGTISEQADTTIGDPYMQQLLGILEAKGDHFAPLTHLDANTVLFYKLTPTWVRYGNFAGTDGTDAALVEIPL